MAVANTGTYDMDTTGDFIRNAFIATNTSFAYLYSSTPGTPQLVNVGTYPNDGTGDTLEIAFNKINANFAYLWSLASHSTQPYVINTGSIGNIDGVVGFPADPGKLAWLKINANFLTVTTVPQPPPPGWVFGQSAFGVGNF